MLNTTVKLVPKKCRKGQKLPNFSTHFLNQVIQFLLQRLVIVLQNLRVFLAHIQNILTSQPVIQENPNHFLQILTTAPPCTRVRKRGLIGIDSESAAAAAEN
ncbi:hypothetical protein MIMGU_mgv1a016912mg [Erythranthe guttata]|uniref:Uncharacterized protein n=1 Tax=Erythranthe guttata TaxID=4155 RepID=A0A022PZM5_ERYGU|nr:hypothetical protein MIMGU_mgv1a016912mg [Erythranthe guttata]